MTGSARTATMRHMDRTVSALREKLEHAERRIRFHLSPRDRAEPDVALLHLAAAELHDQAEDLLVAGEQLRAQLEDVERIVVAAFDERDLYRELFDRSPAPSLLTNRGGIVERANEAARELLCRTARALDALPLASLLPGSAGAAVAEILDDVRVSHGSRLVALERNRAAVLEYTRLSCERILWLFQSPDLDDAISPANEKTA